MQANKCYQCGEIISPRAKDFRAREYQCKCGYINIIAKSVAYDGRVLFGMPIYGTLVYMDNPNKRYMLNSLKNKVGRGVGCNVRLERFEHDGKCYISNYHCTINIGFDNHTGKIRYEISDGVVQEGENLKPSTNGTLVNNMRLKYEDKVEIPEGGIINLGGIDKFRIEPFVIPKETLDTYKVNIEHVEMTE